jgi:hypothetical protein
MKLKFLPLLIIIASVIFTIPGCKPKEKNASSVEKVFNVQQSVQQTYPPSPASGMEFTSELMKNFIERVDRRQGWMDGRFQEINNSPITELMGDNYTSIDAAFTVEDKNGDLFRNCLVEKEKFGDLLLRLKTGDRIRITGQAVSMATSEEWIKIDSIQVLK